MDKSKHSISTILLVDDRDENILVMEELLEKEGRTFLKATTGEQALKLALDYELDIIILDVQMPGMDGFEIARILKSNRRTKDIPIIFATAEKKENSFMIKGFEEGAIDYLNKPLDREITRAKVNVLLTLQHQKKELIEQNISLEKAALLINNSPDIIGVIDVKTFRIEEINDACTHILGYTPGEMYETPLNNILAKEGNDLMQQFRMRNQERFSIETLILSQQQNARWLQWNVVSKNGKWFFNARDITEVKKAEKVRNSLASIVKQSKDATYIVNSQGAFFSWNNGAQQIYGYSEEEAINMKIWSIIPEEFQADTAQIIQRVSQGELAEPIETKRVAKSGKLIDVLVYSSLIVDSESGEKSIAITERDVTLEKITQEQVRQLNMHLQKNVIQLEAANSELESFSYSVSHDLRAPLRAVSGYTNILEETYIQHFDEEARTVFNTIQRNVRKMSQLIDDLLDFARLGRKAVPKRDMDMNELVKKVLDDQRQTASNAKFIVHPLHHAYGDHALLTQVWTNLVSNALKYSRNVSVPQIEVGSSQNDDETTFFIRDNGVGFESKYVEKLFGVFQRLHSEREFEGTGIGLAIIKRIISKHGGRVWAEGKVNKGATFYFSLPNKV
jgi:PAS domain S-box-containing protein